ncbi:MAG: ATP-binding protein [Candidatus Magasanikbacteria bacterium]|nr:ATP-binding protein [Candidatus Magasanikbacteria bacterium]
MLKLAEIKQIILEQRSIFLRSDAIIQRQRLLESDFLYICNLREAIIITGVRRCGKSYLMKLIWQEIQKKLAIDDNNFLYFNFESEKLLDFTASHFDVLLSAYHEIFTSQKSQKVYLFFDEIQNISGWEKFISRLIEDGKYKIFITGSNASLLSKEIGTALTGRNFSLQLFPVSFKEFYHFRAGGSMAKNDWFDKEKTCVAKKLFFEYFEIGGFPEIVKNRFRPLLEEYLRNIIYRDIVLRRRIKYETSLREIVQFVSSNIGVPLSLKKICQMTKIKNLMTVKNYVSHLTDSFLFFTAHKHSYSIKSQIYNPDKFYLCDVGMYKEINLSPGKNDGRALENMVFNELMRRGFMVDYFSDKLECDFVFHKKNKIIGVAQVCANLTSDNKDREIGGLLSALKEYNLQSGLLLTMEEENEMVIDKKTIRCVPIYKWLLED